MNKVFVTLMATAFYTGYAPFCPGTVGSAMGLLIAWLAHPYLFYATLGLTVLGLLISKPTVTIFKTKDPQEFVLDEVCGMMISVLWLPKELWVYIAAFLLFRFFDVRKPGPIATLDKLKNPTSIMLDDIAAGIATNLILQLACQFIGR